MIIFMWFSDSIYDNMLKDKTEAKSGAALLFLPAEIGLGSLKIKRMDGNTEWKLKSKN